MQGFAHPMDALKLEISFLAGQFKYRRDRVGVVSCELRINPVRHAEELPYAAQVGDIRGGLSRVDRKVREALNLGALDLRVPIGSLDKSDHDPAVQRRGKPVEEIDDVRRSLAVCLHDDAEAVPTGETRVGQHLLDHVKRQLQPVGFLGIDVQPHLRVLGHPCEGQGPFAELGHDAVALGEFVTGMKGRQLDRNSRIFAEIRGQAPGHQRLDGVPVVLEEPIGIALRQCGLPQHVIGMRESPPLQAGRPLDRTLDGCTVHEPSRKQFRGPSDSNAHDRSAQSLQRTLCTTANTSLG